MWYEGVFENIEQEADAEQAEKMSAYMQNQFSFLGIPKPQLKEIIKPYLKIGKKEQMDWNFVFICWNKPYREAQYLALEYISIKQKNFTIEDLSNIKKLIEDKSWWETVDNLDKIVGQIVMKYPEQKQTMLDWSLSDSIWLRRVAIDFQQEYKEKTDTELLSQIIQNNFGSKDFFINKAIGWSLRDYKKTNPVWVNRFVELYQDRLSPLSVKETKKK